MQIGENIKRLRTQRNWTTKDLAAALEEPLQSVSQWESGAAVPEMDRLIHLSLLFEVPLEELTGKPDCYEQKTDSGTPAGKSGKERVVLLLKCLLVVVLILLGILINKVWLRFLLRLI